MNMRNQDYKSFKEFWPFYVTEHRSLSNRGLHFVGTGLSLVFLGLALAAKNPWLLIGMPVSGYAFAWFGHFIVEKNRPATFKHPFYSLLGDYKMFFLMLMGRL